jgi:hypothetical protein
METTNLNKEHLNYGERFVLTFFMAAIVKNLPKINLIMLKMSDTNDLVIKEASGLKTTGVAAMSGCTVTDTQVHTAAALLQTMLNGTVLKPQLYTSNQVLGQKKVVVDLYNTVISFMKIACNNAAVQAGDITAGITLANTCGGRVAKKPAGAQVDFGVTGSGAGWVQIHAKKAVKGEEGHIFRCAIVSGVGVIPVKTSCYDCYTLECTIQITGLTSNTVLAINHSGILPVGHGGKTPVITPIKLKKATLLTTSKKKHPAFNISAPEPYVWDGWIWIVIQ